MFPVGTKVDRHVKLSAAEIAMRAAVNDILHHGDAMFNISTSKGDSESEAIQGVIKTPQPEEADDERQVKPEPNLDGSRSPAASVHNPDAEATVTTEPEDIVYDAVEDQELLDELNPDDLIQQQIREESQQVERLSSTKVRQARRTLRQDHEVADSTDDDIQAWENAFA